MVCKKAFIPTLLQHAINDERFLIKYADRWLAQGTLTAILNQHYKIATILSFSEEELNAALNLKNQRSLNKVGLGTMTEPSFSLLNTSRIYTCVYKRKDVVSRDRVYYIETGPMKPQSSSRLKDCADTGRDNVIEDRPSTTILAAEEIPRKNILRRRRSQLCSISVDDSDPLRPPKRIRRSQTAVTHSQKKLQPPKLCPVWFETVLNYHGKVSKELESWEPVDISDSSSDLNTLMKVLVSTDAEHKNKEMALEKISPKGHDGKISIYWYSFEAKNLFKPDADTDTNILQVLKDRVQLFHSALHSNKNMRNLVEGNPADEDLSPTNVKIISAKIRCIKKVTEFAIGVMGSGIKGNDFQLCCDKVITWANTIGGSEYPTNSETVRRWHTEYRTYSKILIPRRRPSKKKNHKLQTQTTTHP